MRTRNLGVRPVLRVVQCAITAAAIMAAAGCGGGTDNNPPAINNAVVSTNPTPLTYIGGNASVSVNVTDPAGIAPNSVMVDVKDAAGVSLLSGPQVMTSTVNPAGTYNYSFAVPNNLFGTANKVYSVTVTANDVNGNRPVQPVTVGTVTVPFPPGPPAGP